MSEQPKSPTADEDDFDDLPTDYTYGEGSATPAGGADVVGDGLLEIFTATMKLAVLLSEIDEDEFRVISPRLRLLKAAVAELPENPRPRRRVGFRIPVRRPVAKGRKRK